MPVSSTAYFPWSRGLICKKIGDGDKGHHDEEKKY
jgi:hypothetical protein